MVTRAERIYWDLRKRVVPRLRFNQQLYEELLARIVPPGCTWLDAGCGWKLLPEWRAGEERGLIGRAALAIGCDVDASAIVKHRSIQPRVICDLSALPFKDNTIDVITCNMVMEHVDHPIPTLREFARALRVKGRVIIHTPYRWGYFARLAALAPDRLKRKVRPDARESEDYYPVRYRCNTPRTLQRLAGAVGLRESHTAMYASDAITAPLAEHWWGRGLIRLELYWLRLSLSPWFRRLRVTICAVYLK